MGRWSSAPTQAPTHWRPSPRLSGTIFANVLVGVSTLAAVVLFRLAAPNLGPKWQCFVVLSLETFLQFLVLAIDSWSSFGESSLGMLSQNDFLTAQAVVAVVLSPLAGFAALFVIVRYSDLEFIAAVGGLLVACALIASLVAVASWEIQFCDKLDRTGEITVSSSDYGYDGTCGRSASYFLEVAVVVANIVTLKFFKDLRKAATAQKPRTQSLLLN